MTTDQLLLTWIIACGGWLVAVVLAYLGYAERRSVQRAELLLKTVTYFDGGTQKRSIGIALVEGLLAKHPEHGRVLVPLLTNQLLYLLLHPEVKSSVHEERNAVRLFHLLTATPSLRAEHHYSWCEIGDAMNRRLAGEKSELQLSDVTVAMWLKELGHQNA